MKASAHDWFLKLHLFVTSLCVCVRVLVSVPNAINKYWRDKFNRLYGFYVGAAVVIIGRCDLSIGVLDSSTYS